ncbi:MAG TPA: flagellar basal-body rod protein FlgG [Gemmatimonadaceae bacterium]|nr:flagellar basal-body rod protein FlgG [Gemmatimonadaceae bacterium]
MDPALRTAATGMMAQQTRTEVIANNLANVNTTAFKRSRAHFVDLLYQTVQTSGTVAAADAETTPTIQVGRGTRLAGVQRLHAQGPVEATQRSLDVAIEGEGFFQVQLSNGQTAFTRDGSFEISDQGTLVTSEGLTVLPGIKIPADAGDISISRNGIVSVAKAGSATPVELGRIEIARFANPSGLEAMGENLYSSTAASGEPVTGFPDDDGFGRLLQGHLEGSNVEIVQEMVDMIAAMRAYEINSKTVKNCEQMGDVTASLIR